MMQLHLPTELRLGAGVLADWLPRGDQVLLVVSGALDGAVRDELAERWKAAGRRVSIVIKPSGEPESAAIDEAASRISMSPDVVAAVGGGSTLDFAKGLAVVLRSRVSVAEHEFGASPVESVIPLELAPSTAGSGSEVTPYAVINNTATRRKFTLSHPGLQPAVARVDVNLLRSLGGESLLAPALDAFTHCLEAVLNREGPGLIEPLAMAGLRIAWKNLEAVGATPGGTVPPPPSAGLLEDLARLSVYGGLSIAHRRTGLIHTLSVAFAPFTDAAHGTLNAALLPFALEHNLPGYGGLLARIWTRMTRQAVNSDADALERLSGWTSSLRGHVAWKEGRTVVPIVTRVLQDKGLPSVSHGRISQEALAPLVERIIHET